MLSISLCQLFEMLFYYQLRNTLELPFAMYLLSRGEKKQKLDQ